MELAAGGRRGGVLARAARRAHGRPAGGAAGPRRAADHRPGPPVRPDGQVVRRAAAASTANPRRAAHVRSIAGRAVATAVAGPAGPVHLNVPFREPLLPDGPLGRSADEVAAAAVRHRRDGAAPARRRRARGLGAPGSRASSTASSSPVRTTTRRSPPPSRALAAATGFPILADPLSGLRRAPTTGRLVIARADQLDAPGPWIDAHRPRLVIRSGAMPTSKPIAGAARTDEAGADRDRRRRAAGASRRSCRRRSSTPMRQQPSTRSPRGSRMAPPAGRATPDGPPAGWRRTGRRREAMDGWLAALDEPFEGAPFAALAAAAARRRARCGPATPCPSATWTPGCRATDRAIPCRCEPRRQRHRRRRLDGAGRRRRGRRPGRARRRRRVVPPRPQRARRREAPRAVRDDRPGQQRRRRHLLVPAAGRPRDARDVACPDRYEELFGTPHGIDVGPIVTAFGGEYAAGRAGGPARRRSQRSIATPGVQVLELRTDRARNVALHREVAAVVAAAIRRRERASDVDGLRWEVRSRGVGPAAAPDPRVHGSRDVAGPGTPPRSRGASA